MCVCIYCQREIPIVHDSRICIGDLNVHWPTCACSRICIGDLHVHGPTCAYIYFMYLYRQLTRAWAYVRIYISRICIGNLHVHGPTCACSRICIGDLHVHGPRYAYIYFMHLYRRLTRAWAYMFVYIFQGDLHVHGPTFAYSCICIGNLHVHGTHI